MTPCGTSSRRTRYRERPAAGLARGAEKAGCKAAPSGKDGLAESCGDTLQRTWDSGAN